MGKAGFFIFCYPDGDPGHPQNLMGSKLDQEPSSDFFHKVPISSICTVRLTNRQINGYENNTSLAKVIKTFRSFNWRFYFSINKHTLPVWYKLGDFLNIKTIKY